MYRPKQLVHVSVWWLYLVLPSLLCDNLPCFYSPVLEHHKTFELVAISCPTQELCFKADVRHGNHSALSSRGCMAERDCSQVHDLHLRGMNYTMSYTCCDLPYCNSSPGVAATSLYVVVALVTGAVMAGSL